MPLRSLWGQSKSATEVPASRAAGSWQGGVPASHRLGAPPGSATSADDVAHPGEDVTPPILAGLLSEVIDPEVGVNIVDLGLIYGIRMEERTARIVMSLTTPGCPLSDYMEDSIGRVLAGVPGVDDVDLQIIWDPRWDPAMMSVRAKRELGWPV